MLWQSNRGQVGIRGLKGLMDRLASLALDSECKMMSYLSFIPDDWQTNNFPKVLMPHITPKMSKRDCLVVGSGDFCFNCVTNSKGLSHTLGGI